MKNLTAIIRWERAGNVTSLVDSDYNTKAQFKSDLKGNGASVIAIFTDEQIEEINKLSSYDVQQMQYDWRNSNKFLAYDYVQQVILNK